MIKIRYRDPNELSPGLHAAAECHGRSTTVYLLCGLTAAERRAALRRLRLSARMGHCPRLPAAQLAFALFADRIRTGAGQTGAVFRSHPAGSTVPVMVVSAGAIAFLLLSTVSIRVLHPPRTEGQLPPSVPAPSVVTVPGSPPSPVGGGWGRSGSGSGSSVRQLTSTRTGSGGSAAFSVPPISGFGAAFSVPPISGFGTGGASNTGTSTSHSSGPGSGPGSGSGTSTGSGTNGGSTPGSTPDPGSTADPGSTPAPAPGATSAGAGASTPGATPSSPAAAQPAASAGSASGLCLDVGPLGVCLDL
jgi:hypothetical protein